MLFELKLVFQKKKTIIVLLEILQNQGTHSSRFVSVSTLVQYCMAQ